MLGAPIIEQIRKHKKFAQWQEEAEKLAARRRKRISYVYPVDIPARISDPDKFLEGLLKDGYVIMRSWAGKYERRSRDVSVNWEDFYQEMALRLVAAYQKNPAIFNTMIDEGWFAPWLEKASRQWLSDVVYKHQTAKKRDASKTVHASHSVGEDGSSLLDVLGEVALDGPLYRPEKELNPVRSAVVWLDFVEGLGELAAALVTTILDPSLDLRQDFWKRYRKQSLGFVNVTDDKGNTVFQFRPREGNYAKGPWSIVAERIDGPGVYESDKGPVQVTKSGNGFRFRFSYSLSGYFGENGQGEFHLEVIRPSPKMFDLWLLTDYVGQKVDRELKVHDIKRAWKEAEERYDRLFGTKPVVQEELPDSNPLTGSDLRDAVKELNAALQKRVEQTVSTSTDREEDYNRKPVETIRGRNLRKN